ncbi:MAG: hypothetical protein ACRDRL_18510, partial [Sciscionella sp.]
AEDGRPLGEAECLARLLNGRGHLIAEQRQQARMEAVRQSCRNSVLAAQVSQTRRELSPPGEQLYVYRPAAR